MNATSGLYVVPSSVAGPATVCRLRVQPGSDEGALPGWKMYGVEGVVTFQPAQDPERPPAADRQLAGSAPGHCSLPAWQQGEVCAMDFPPVAPPALYRSWSLAQRGDSLRSSSSGSSVSEVACVLSSGHLQLRRAAFLVSA